MQIYVIGNRKISSLILPKNIIGSYFLRDDIENTLISIKAQDDEWVAYSNERMALYHNGTYCDEIHLKEYMQVILHNKVDNRNIIIFTCPVIENSLEMYHVKNNIAFTVGSSSNNGVIYQCNYVTQNQLKLTFTNNEWYLETLSNDGFTYLNGFLFLGKKQLQFGDVVVIFGLKMIFLGDSVYFNNPNSCVQYDTNIFIKNEVKEENNFEINDVNSENSVTLYSQDDYFDRKPNFSETVVEEHFVLNSHPQLPKQDETPFFMTIGPMMTMSLTSLSSVYMAVATYQNTHEIKSIIPTVVMAISMLTGTLLWPSINRRYTKKKTEKEVQKINTAYLNYLAEKEKELKAINMVQKQILLSNNISSNDCYKMILAKSKTLWKREISGDDFLTLRLGLGTVPMKLDYNYPEPQFSVDTDELNNKMLDMLDKYKDIEGAPVVESFAEDKLISIIGKYDLIKSYFDNLMLQIIYFHSYQDLKIVLLTSKENEEKWNYLKTSLYLFDNRKSIRFFATNQDDIRDVSKYLLEVFISRKNSISKDKNGIQPYRNFSTYYLIVTDDYKSVKGNPFFYQFLEEDRNLGFSLVILNETFANLPVECENFIGINSEKEGGIINKKLEASNQNQFVIENVENLDLKKCFKILSNIPLMSKGESFVLPEHYGFLEMFDVGNVDQLNSLERWETNDSVTTLATPIGITSTGDLFNLDLHEKVHGPHGLIAGMTGSGKSDFIISYILSLAVNYHPDDVQFILIDYKGGGLVGAFLNEEANISLPHLAGTITNLDKSDIQRSLDSIESELERRQQMFNAAKTKLNESTIDIYSYQKYYHEGLLDEPMAHLFIISDEFAELKSQQPEFMDKLISTARIGRSLGVHLILATQKPGGVVNDQIWSNSRFKVCLKVQDLSDSNEVIKRPDAAFLKNSGRFYLLVGYDELFEIGQAAYSESNYIPQDKVYHEIDDDICFIDKIGRIYKKINTPRNNVEIKGQQLQVIVKYLNDLAKKQNIFVRQLWLEKLSNTIYLSELKKKYNYKPVKHHIAPIVGEYDDPKHQLQSPYILDLSANGSVCVVSLDEKNTIINTILFSLISTYTTREVNIYVLDFDSETLKVFSDAPQVGDVIFANEVEKLNNVFKRIYKELDSRKSLLQQYNGSYDFYCKSVEEPLPAIVFIIHGYENFKENGEDRETLFEKIVREGPKYGIYSVVTAVSERSMKLSLRSSMQLYLALKLPALSDYNILLNKKCPVIPDVPNRGVIVLDDNAYEFQTAVICDEANQFDYIKNYINRLKEVSKSAVSSIKVLPEHVSWDDVVDENFSIGHVPVGISSETMENVYFDFSRKLMSLITSNDNKELKDYVELIYHKISGLSNIKVLVFDDAKMLSINSDNISINEFNNLVKSKERKENLIVFITGLSKWVDRFSDDEKDNFDSYFEEINKLGNCHFIFADKQGDIKPLTYKNWFKLYVSSDRGLFLGNGVNSNTFFTLTNSYRELSKVLEEHFGYVIIKGKASIVKFVENIDDSE